ncbi:hypothetical protein PIB30_069174 [Stylosanthes scabra]|uniref:Uncharacterized protein n=1 Tax=Stylosanthes scabra TaxID=79078 RepID=A0ABU6TNZ7_9FABA|nr:hypothetical protein [Stylosanthes scabra]
MHTHQPPTAYVAELVHLVSYSAASVVFLQIWKAVALEVSVDLDALTNFMDEFLTTLCLKFSLVRGWHELAVYYEVVAPLDAIIRDSRAMQPLHDSSGNGR